MNTEKETCSEWYTHDTCITCACIVHVCTDMYKYKQLKANKKYAKTLF